MILAKLFTDPVFFVIWVVAIVYGITIHEFAHVAMARYLGDHTGEDMGRLTLNPLAHVDPMGFLLLLVIGFGWGRPAPFNPFNLHKVKSAKLGSALVALAGPVSNLLSIFVFVVVTRVLLGSFAFSPESLIIQFFIFLIMINVVLMVFNLLPIPPLDGSKIAYALLPDSYEWQQRKAMWETKGPWILFLVIIIDSFTPGSFLGGLFQWFFGLVLKMLG
ncbi:MAG: site-2 protease family protein [Candidatus Jacksonbacteria bacterium]|jgi:Zn-dependent protease|nr:site-2 protease family protein [Candidatus Jacksonbacteria bacterium]MBT6034779.1 site-2 protease family protein [Candidatus Jacksonbacteria bacterium]MBT6301217.1 site-2 protease family protein [Candidatus Jacksonbacteria bacterium]MBT6954820.1 site-2 protease family protein [Candidatus Jacksonbacteria bacterium]MBT7007984.1 site-2 protease family protein [Candidatus Jacksonbacteria bacterium]